MFKKGETVSELPEALPPVKQMRIMRILQRK
jgi:hypothetical protein